MVYQTLGDSPVEWAGRTAPEVNEVADAEGSVLVVPIASLEQHGYHLPVATDTILCDAVAREGTERVHDDGTPVLKLPPVWGGFSPHHHDLGGTVTIDHKNLYDYVTDAAASAVDYGFDGICLVNGHGGNGSVLNDCKNKIGVDYPDLEATSVTYFTLAGAWIDEVRDSEVGGMGHAGEFETSLMLHLRPDLVREDEYTTCYREEPYDHSAPDMFHGGPISTYKPFSEYSETGVLGDPDHASAEKGEEIFERLGDEMEHLLGQVHEQSKL
jgi:creatinine amidohydrolase